MLWVLVVISLAFFQTKGFIPHDEGWILNAAQRILDGQIPYRDFYFLYTPGAIFSTAAFFKLFGESVLVARILAIVCSFISTFLIYKLVLKTTPNKQLAIGSLLLFLVWGPFQINFTWMVMFCITLALSMIYSIHKSIELKKPTYILLAGILCSLTLLFKQNFGAAALIVALIAFLTNNKVRTFEYIARFTFGFSLPILLFVVYLYANGALSVFISSMYYLMFQKIFLEGMLASPILYNENIIKQGLKLLLYGIPLILGGFASYLVYKKDKKYLFVLAFPVSFYLLSIRPTTDIVHLAPLIAISGFSFSFIYKHTSAVRLKNILLIFMTAIIALGAYTVLFRGYYRWGAPILANNYFYSDAKVNVFVDNQDVIRKVTNQLKSSKSDYIFIYHFSPIFYFVSGKKNPTYYDDLPEPIMTNTVQNKVISDVKKSGVDIILSDSNLQIEQSIIAKYVRNNYLLEKQISNYQIWQKTKPKN